jgi:HIRAN domain
MPWSSDSEVRHFHTKIVGVTYKNSDGTHRQKLISQCQAFETLDLDHEEDNAHDPNAVRVCRQNGQQLGYLNANLADEIVSKSKKGYRFVTVIKAITGGQRRGMSFGVNLLIVEAEPKADEGQVKRYLKQMIRDDPELKGAKVTGGSSGKFVMTVLVIVAGLILYVYLAGRK